MTSRVKALPVEIFSAALAVALVLSALGLIRFRFRDQPSVSILQILPILGVFFVAIVIGEVFRVRLSASRHSAPLATAAALAFAMTVESPMGTTATYKAPVVVAVTAAAMLIGLIPSLARGRPVHLSELANGLIGIALTAVLFRELPISEGRAIVDLQAGWPAYVLALVMVVVAGFSLTVEMLLLAMVRATRSHAPLLQTFQDEFRAGLGLSAALSATGALVALAERPLGILAVPLFLFPLGLTQFAVRRQIAIRQTYGQTIRTLSRLTEFGGYTQSGHASRVAELAIVMGQQLGMSEREVLDLEYAALLHDIGQVALIEPIPGGATVLAAPTDQRRIARDGAEIVRQTGVLDNVAVILEAQTTPYRQVRELGEPLPMSSRIIKVCNAYDDIAGEFPTPARHTMAMERIHLGLGYEYDPHVVDALARVLQQRET